MPLIWRLQQNQELDRIIKWMFQKNSGQFGFKIMIFDRI